MARIVFVGFGAIGKVWKATFRWGDFRVLRGPDMLTKGLERWREKD
jgi:hypothetical protein